MALSWGVRGRRFKSSHTDQLISPHSITYVTFDIWFVFLRTLSVPLYSSKFRLIKEWIVVIHSQIFLAQGLVGFKAQGIEKH